VIEEDGPSWYECILGCDDEEEEVIEEI